MAAMWDGYGEKVTDPAEIIPAIKRAAVTGKPSIINVEVDHESLSPWTQRAKDTVLSYDEQGEKLFKS